MSRLAAKKPFSSMAQRGLTPGKIILLAFLSLFFMLLLSIYLFLKFYVPPIKTDRYNDNVFEIIGWDVNDFKRDPDGVPIESQDTDDTENAWRKGCYTFLIAGKDYDTWNTDVMMYIMLDTVDYKISIAQLPRDTYVNNAQGLRLNGILSSGRNAAIRTGRARDESTVLGVRALSETVRMTFGVPINYYIFLDLDGFNELVDLVGGVEVYIPFHMKYDDPDQNLYIDLPSGMTLLDGKKAEHFVRFRGTNPWYEKIGYQSYPRADIDRLDAQKQFMTALMKKLTSINFSQIQSMIRLAEQYITTNINAISMAAFAKEILQVKPENIRMITLPGEWNGSINRYTLYRRETIDIINNYLNPYTSDIPDDRFNIREFSRRDIGYANLDPVTMEE